MLIRNNLQSILYIILILSALFYDVLLGDSKYPLVTLIVCGILILYERVSPFIYVAR